MPGGRVAPLWATGATILDDRTIRFDLKDRTPDTIFNMGILDSEFVVPTGGTPNPSGRVHLYTGHSNDGFRKGGATRDERARVRPGQ